MKSMSLTNNRRYELFHVNRLLVSGHLHHVRSQLDLWATLAVQTTAVTRLSVFKCYLRLEQSTSLARGGGCKIFV